MTILRIGKLVRFVKSSNAGITLVEVLAAVVILSIGIVAVYQPLLRSLSVLSDMDRRLEANRLADDELWLLQANATRLKSASAIGENGQAVGVDRVYDYQISVKPLTKDKMLNVVDLSMRWAISERRKQITQSVYVEIPIAR